MDFNETMKRKCQVNTVHNFNKSLNYNFSNHAEADKMEQTRY